jgi:hypothetical protein
MDYSPDAKGLVSHPFDAQLVEHGRHVPTWIGTTWGILSFLCLFPLREEAQRKGYCIGHALQHFPP